MNMHPNNGKSVNDILMSLKNVANVNVSIRAEFFGIEWAASQPVRRFHGKIGGWQNKSLGIVKIKWDGWDRNKSNSLETLMGDDPHGESFDFQLEKWDDGTEVLFRTQIPSSSTAASAKRRRANDSGAAMDARLDADDEEEVGDEPEIEADIEVEKHGRTWVKQSPEGIKVDERCKHHGRWEPKLNSQTINSKDICEIFEYLVPPEWWEAQLQHTNCKLHGDGVNTKMSKGELIQWWGYALALSLNPGRPVEEMWSDRPKEGEILPPPSMGRHGMIFARWKKIRSVLRFGPEDAASFESDPWCFIRAFVEMFNTHMAEVISPGWLLTVDESMSAWRGRQGMNDPTKIPFLSWVPRKPEPLGCEMKTAGCALSKMMLRVELCEGKATHAKLPYFNKVESPHTTATTLRLVEPWLGKGYAVYGDSWFASIKTASQLLEHGTYFVGDVKTNHAGFPKDALEAATGEERGAWAVYKSDIEGDVVYGVSHRRGPAVHEFISTFGTTLKGKPHTTRIADEEDEGAAITYEIERKCPRILNDASEAQPCIDRHNRYRQFILAIEKRIHTDHFCLRLATTMFGMLFVNCFFAKQTFGDQQACFKTEMNKLAMYMMGNPTRMAEIAVSGGPTRVISPTHSVRSNSSYADELANHVLVPLSAVEGYKGAYQPRCNVCNKGCRYVCLTCTKAADRIWPCHPTQTKFRGKVVKHSCWATHLSCPAACDRGKKRTRCVQRVNGEEDAM